MIYSLSNVFLSRFTSIPETFYWFIVTITTTGYGDIVPTTVGGKILSIVSSIAGTIVSGSSRSSSSALLLSLLQVLAIPISIISANFHTEHQRMVKARLLESEHNKLMANEAANENKLLAKGGVVSRTYSAPDLVL